MRTLLILLLLVAPAWAQAPDGTNAKPIRTAPAQGALIPTQGRVACANSSTDLLAVNSFQGCRSLMLKNASSDDVVICPGFETCATTTGGIHLAQDQGVTIDRSLLIDTKITCISDGTSNVHYYLECGG